MKKQNRDHDYSYQGSHHQCNYVIDKLSTIETDRINNCLLTLVIGY